MQALCALSTQLRVTATAFLEARGEPALYTSSLQELVLVVFASRGLPPQMQCWMIEGGAGMQCQRKR